MLFRLDVNETHVVSNGTNLDAGPTLVWSADSLGDGDHQLYVHVYSLVTPDESVVVDYFEYVVPLLHLMTIFFQQAFCHQG